MTRRRRVKLVRNPEHAGHLPYDEWIPAHAVKFNSDGSTTLMTEGPGHHGQHNVAGYKDASGTFHPIRWDPDYDPDELSRGEGSVATDWAAPRGFFVGRPRAKKRKRKVVGTKSSRRR